MLIGHFDCTCTRERVPCDTLAATQSYLRGFGEAVATAYACDLVDRQDRDWDEDSVLSDTTDTLDARCPPRFGQLG
eukprot:13568598-Alexandrium_andersonii.AAC.1